MDVGLGTGLSVFWRNGKAGPNPPRPFCPLLPPYHITSSFSVLTVLLVPVCVRPGTNTMSQELCACVYVCVLVPAGFAPWCEGVVGRGLWAQPLVVGMAGTPAHGMIPWRLKGPSIGSLWILSLALWLVLLS